MEEPISLLDQPMKADADQTSEEDEDIDWKRLQANQKQIVPPMEEDDDDDEEEEEDEEKQGQAMMGVRRLDDILHSQEYSRNKRNTTRNSKSKSMGNNKKSPIAIGMIISF